MDPLFPIRSTPGPCALLSLDITTPYLGTHTVLGIRAFFVGFDRFLPPSVDDSIEYCANAMLHAATWLAQQTPTPAVFGFVRLVEQNRCGLPDHPPDLHLSCHRCQSNDLHM